MGRSAWWGRRAFSPVDSGVAGAGRSSDSHPSHQGRDPGSWDSLGPPFRFEGNRKHQSPNSRNHFTKLDRIKHVFSDE